MQTTLITGSVAILLSLHAAAAASVRKDGDEFAIAREDGTRIATVSFDVGDVAGRTKGSAAALDDGSYVWNLWCEERDHRFRFEAVNRADGATELSLLGEMEMPAKDRQRILIVEVPAAILMGRRYEALLGNARRHVRSEGTFSADMAPLKVRWLSAAGLTFDFNATGAGEYASGYSSRAINGVWTVSYDAAKGMFRMTGGGIEKNLFGGFAGTKLVIREGTFDDYDAVHFQRRYHYHDHLDSRIADLRRVAFGAERRGSDFADGDIAFSAEYGRGWTEGGAAEIVRGAQGGVYYSHARGTGAARYRIAGLPPGFYIATLHIGNWTCETNSFSVSVCGETLGRDISVPPRTARTISRAVRIVGGAADVRFAGDWLVSGISLQPLLSDEEDFSVRRGFWRTRGYEPATLYRTSDFEGEAFFPIADETVEMPPPGGECPGRCRQLERPVELPDPQSPSLAWLRKAKTCRLLNNNSSLAELDSPAVMEAYFDSVLDGHDYASAMISGMHSRHTYRTHVTRGLDAIGRMCESLHKRGIKVFDHHDATLLWNFTAGFRTMMERLPETVRGTSDYLPGPQLCPNNPAFKKTYRAYLRALVERGVDGFQLDELEFWPHGCQCRACREDFHRDTGWWMPLDETHPALKDPFHPLAKALFEWRTKKITDWYVELRRELRELKPDLALSTYTTHWGLIRSLPREYATYDLLDLPRAINYFGTEIMTRNVLQSSRSLLPYRKMYNQFVIRYGVPMWGWYYNSGWQGDYFSFAVANMCGQMALLSDCPRPADAPDFMRWGASAANMRREGAESIAEVALLFSSASRNWNTLCGFAGELFGTAQELEAMHVPYDIIGEACLSERWLKKYGTLVLGASNCISDRDAAAVRAFAEAGGTVVLSALAGCFDEVGTKRERPVFAEFTGYAPRRPEVSRPEPNEAPRWREAACGKGRFVYFPRLEAERFWAREITPPNVWKFDPSPAGQKAFRAAMAKILGASAHWRVEAPERVFATLWREADGTLAAHFLNASGANLKPGEKATFEPPSPAFPEIAQKISFTLPVPPQASSATAFSPDFPDARPLAFSRNPDGTATVLLPPGALKAYTLVKIH